METIDKALLASEIIQERKAVDPVLLQVCELSSLTDYFLIASGNSSRQVQAISRHLARRMREKGYKVHSIEGENEGQWILMDYGDLVIHIFFDPVREFYNLEGLWTDAPIIEIDKNENINNRIR